MSDRYRRKQRLDSLFKKSDTFSDGELMGHWARYLCVQTYGYLEKCFVEIVEDYCRKASCPRTFSYVSSRLKRLNNIGPSEIEDLLSIFDNQWREKYDKIFVGSKEREHAASILSNRNKISHGEDSGIRLSTITTYRTSIESILDELEKIVK